MKKISSFLVLMIFGFYGNSTTWTINNIGNTFSPSTITMSTGDDVNFVLSSIHDAVEVSETTWNQNGTTPLNGGFSLPLGGGSVATTKLTVGTHYFVCTPHANEGMKGRIIVQSCTVLPQPGVINGENMVCPNAAIRYIISPVAGANSYTWTLPSGWSGSSTSDTILVTTSTSGGIVSVAANNDCGKSVERTLGVFVSGPPAQPSAIAGEINICPGGSATYTVGSIPGVSTFAWTLPEGWSGSSTSNSILAMSDSSGGTVSVVAVNFCGSSLPSNLNVSIRSVPSRPSAINGPDTVCANSSNVYIVTARNDATSYKWFLPDGWSGSSTTNTITAMAGQGIGVVAVVALNQCGSSDTSSLNISPRGRPLSPLGISGRDSVCVNSLTVYKIDKVPGASSYTWTLPPGWTGASSLDTISAMAGSNSGTISVVANNVCGASAPSTMTVHTTNLPGQPSIISGPDTLCPNSLGLFSVVSANDLSAYSWILPNGWNGSSQTNTITARAGNNGGILTVIASNVCGFSPIRTLTTTVSIKVLPGVIEKITGLDTLCVNSNAIFTAKPSIGATSYTWTLPDGWSGTSSTNSITAIAGSSGNISVIANNQCGSTQPKTFAVTTKSPPPGISFIIGKSTVCKASTNLFNASAVQGASSYTWSLPPGWSGMSTTNFLNAISGNTSGDISVTANNACGSSSPFIFPVATEQINTSISITGITLVSNSIGATYQWLDCFDNSKITGQTSQVYTPAQSGTYAVIISRNGCVDTSACIMLSTVSTTTSLNELGIKIFPNPARSFFSVEMQQNHPATIEIIDALGRKVMTRDLKFPLLRFDVTSLPKGIYFANFKVSNQQVTQKLLIL